MKIVINCVGWSKEIRGVDRYFVELLKALLKIDQKNNYYAFVGSWQNYFDHFQPCHNLHIIKVKWSSNRYLRNIWHAFFFPLKAKTLQPDIIHLPNTMPLFIKMCPTICTIHDLLEYVYPETFGVLQTIMRKFIVKLETKLADLIITVSDLTRRSLIEVLRIPSSKITTIYSGVSRDKFCVSKNDQQSHKDLFKIDKKYILFVGILEKKKNLDGLINSYSLLPDEIKNKYKLVIVGKPDNAYENAKRLIASQKLDDKVIFLNQVEKDLEILYQEASLFILPSFYEGYGLPVLEAMACGIPVVVSKNVAVADRFKKACLMVDPNDHKEIARGILTLLTDLGLRRQYIENALESLGKFTWEKCARETLEVYKRCAKQSGRNFFLL